MIRLLIGEIDEHDEISHYYGNSTYTGIIPLNNIFITKLNKSSNALDVKNLIEDLLKELPDGTKTNWMVCKHYL
jgi:ethanolamine utilization protein EutA (predicted chaperonin)